MRGAALLIWVSCLVAASRASPLARTSADDKHTYPVVSLDLEDELTIGKYTKFIVALRDKLRNPADVRFPVPVLPSRTNVQTSERFVLVNLSNFLAGKTVTLALDAIDASVVGYRAGRYSVFLRPADKDAATSHLFREVTARRSLGFTGSYTHLEAIQQGVNRSTTDLGADALNRAVSAMYHYAQRPNSRALGSLASAFLVTIQMVSEAARFRYIEDEVLIRIRERRNYPGDVRVIGLENNWGRLSDEIQNSYQGEFIHEVEIQTPGGPFHVDDTLLAMRLIGLVLFTCNPRRPSPASISSKSDAICPENQEPTVQIAGPGGLCADVRDHKYNDGNRIQLYPCSRSSDNVNQLWTFKRDGTIRSNGGKCLGSNGHTPGSYIMIYDCRYASSDDKFKWDVWTNGTIVSRRSGLVLAARSLESGTLLSAEVDSYTIGQSWLPSNNTEPLVTPILGLSSGLCFGADLLLEKCVPRKADQAWALYRDGSIRPNQTRLNSCLTVHRAEASSSPPSSVKIALCEAASSLQRWVYPNDGTIMNLETKLVMDITPGSTPSIILAYHTGDFSQIWRL